VGGGGFDQDNQTRWREAGREGEKIDSRGLDRVGRSSRAGGEQKTRPRGACKLTYD